MAHSSPAVSLDELRIPAGALRGLELLLPRVAAEDLGILAGSQEAHERRETLASILRTWIEDAQGSRAEAFVANVGSVVLAVLAVRHELEGKGEHASLSAAITVPWLLEPPQRYALRPHVAELLEDLRDGIALDDGHAHLVRRVRNLVERSVPLDPLALHLARGRWLLGGRRIRFVRKARRGGRTWEQRYLGPDNAEGRLLGLLATGRSVGAWSASVLSHVRSALSEVSGGAIKVTRDGKIEPPLVLTSRAARIASRIKIVQRGHDFQTT